MATAVWLLLIHIFLTTIWYSSAFLENIPNCHHGQCQWHLTAPHHTCLCDPGYSGRYCDQDACHTKPCGSHGTCHVSTSSPHYSCHCHSGFLGSRCRIRGDICSSHPCGHHGNCSSTTISPYYQCQCGHGYSGEHCERDACYLNPCTQNSRCSTTTDFPHYKCTCDPRIDKHHCDGCLNQPCGQHGSCSSTLTSPFYTCQCQDGYSGDQCQDDACSTQPCGQNGNCSSIMSAPYYRCDCKQSYTGDRCQLMSIWTHWTRMTSCSVTCGTGVQTRSRICSTQAGCTGSDKETMKCTPKPCNDCGALADPVNGNAFVTSTSVGGMAYYTCDLGYIINGTSNRYCLLSTYWSVPEPTCIPAVGTWSEWSEWTGCGNTCGAGTQTRYRLCNKPVPSASACTGYSSETASRTLPPCPACPQLSAPVHGHMTLVSGDVGGMAMFSCQDGYELNGGASSIYCLSILVWSGDIPKCVPSSGTWTDWSSWSGSGVTCGTDQVARYRICQDQNSMASCPGKDSDFSTKQLRPCNVRRQNAVGCLQLSHPVNGFVQQHSTDVGSVASYFCNSGYLMHGSASRECMFDGTWSGTHVTCIVA